MIVEIAGLTKVYPGKPQSVTAVAGIDLSVGEGEIFGLLGPNGAGKTTTISICTTRALPTTGSIRIAGINVVEKPSQARVNIGVVPPYNTLHRSLTIYENLYYHCLYFGYNAGQARERTQALLAQFSLGDRGAVYPSQLSGGMQQRVQIARAIAHHPAVLFLDEPSAGLDPQSRLAMWEAVRGLRDEGITVVLTTHYMAEADELCDRIAVVDRGKVLALDTPAQLKKTLGAATVIEMKLKQLDGLDALLTALRQLQDVTEVERSSTGVRILAHSAEGLLAELMQIAQSYGVRDLSISEPSLETVFIRLTGRELRD